MERLHPRCTGRTDQLDDSNSNNKEYWTTSVLIVVVDKFVLNRFVIVILAPIKGWADRSNHEHCNGQLSLI